MREVIGNANEDESGFDGTNTSVESNESESRSLPESTSSEYEKTDDGLAVGSSGWIPAR
jgi:hypothetical protein